MDPIRQPGMGDPLFFFDEAATSLTISGIPPEYTAETFRTQLDDWGMAGTYDFFYMPVDRGSAMSMGYQAFMNFTDTSFAILCYWILQQAQFPGALTASEVQGRDNNVAHFREHSNADELYSSALVVVDNPEPSPRAVNSANSLLSPQCREQFHKTKLCAFFKKNRCEMGVHCPFAHSQEEFMPAPDLAKTKLCYSFFCNKCSDPQCKFAHGFQELRAATQAMGSMDYCSPEFLQSLWYFGALEDSMQASNYGLAPQDFCDGLPIFGYQGHYVSEMAESREDESSQAGSEFSVPASQAPACAHRATTSMPILQVGASKEAPTSSSSREPGPAATVAPLPLFRWSCTPGPCQSDGVAMMRWRDAHDVELHSGHSSATQLGDEELSMCRRRSWSEADLLAYREAMEECEVC